MHGRRFYFDLFLNCGGAPGRIYTDFAEKLSRSVEKGPNFACGPNPHHRGQLTQLSLVPADTRHQMGIQAGSWAQLPHWNNGPSPHTSPC